MIAVGGGTGSGFNQVDVEINKRDSY